MAEVTHKDIMLKVEKNAAAIDDIRRDIADIREDTAKMLEIVEAYSAIKTGGRFISWTSKILAGLIAIWVFFKAGLQFLAEISHK